MQLDTKVLHDILDGMGQLLDYAGKIAVAIGAIILYFGFSNHEGPGMRNGILAIVGGIGIIAIGAYLKTIV